VNPRWTESSGKHGIPQRDQIFAIANASYSVELAGESLDEGTVWLYIGPEHAQTDRELELLVNVYDDGREAVVFHAQQLNDKFRRLREENRHGWRD